MATVEFTVNVAGADLDAFVTKVIKKIALDVVANLVAQPQLGGTPVDTGWARANWIPRIGASSGIPSGTRPTQKDSASSAEQQAGVAQVATGYRISFGIITIANAVPYIGRLNEGHSQQAPAGFVQAAIVKALTQDLGT